MSDNASRVLVGLFRVLALEEVRIPGVEHANDSADTPVSQSNDIEFLYRRLNVRHGTSKLSFCMQLSNRHC